MFPEDVQAGIHVDSLLKRLVVGYQTGQFFEVVFSELINDKTRVHVYRRPIERIGQLAPFIELDTDPYLHSRQNPVPQLQRVIVVFRGKLPMGPHDRRGADLRDRGRQARRDWRPDPNPARRLVMEQVSAVSALGVTILLALYRPRLDALVVGPALAALTGLSLMAAAGHISLQDIGEAWIVLWHALIAIASIMIIASAAGHLGVIDRLAATVVRLGGSSARTLFLLVFCLSTCAAGETEILDNCNNVCVIPQRC